MRARSAPIVLAALLMTASGCDSNPGGPSAPSTSSAPAAPAAVAPSAPVAKTPARGGKFGRRARGGSMKTPTAASAAN